MVITISTKELKNLIRQSVKEALGTELMRLRSLALPEVSEKEQKDIEKRYGRPSRKSGHSTVVDI